MSRTESEQDGYDLSGPRVLLIVTGSVAAIKTGDLVNALLNEGASTVTIVPTETAMHFIERSDTPVPWFVPREDPGSDAGSGGDGSGGDDAQDDQGDPRINVFTDSEEWELWQQRGDPVLHIDMRRVADVAVVAPASANTLAKAAAGIADNLATCLLRCWGNDKPLIVCPAMNTAMWAHPVTRTTLARLRGFGYEVVDPVSKTLACGDVGVGAMAEVADIARITIARGRVTVSREIEAMGRGGDAAEPQCCSGEACCEDRGQDGEDEDGDEAPALVPMDSAPRAARSTAVPFTFAAAVAAFALGCALTFRFAVRSRQ
jgi:phosphopantothenoylcysteine decarboxylase